ncbi:hypothetical protein [Aquibium sp. ELW1220]|uniref:hypothetical protein n=1 Tax=Aquibium sp. ELW1220 TaxID=2976766 RepID=UPI0025AECEF5|nr:hypothetical protein [Aquibium sp. ELW1220]MDN2581109.1 hypothetical protein [Aquibium sp. ELW1220]
MSASENGNGTAGAAGARPGSLRIEVVLNEEQFAALEGWRYANRVADRSEAARELVRLGLLAEIARVYRLVAGAAEFGEAAEDGFETQA